MYRRELERFTRTATTVSLLGGRRLAVALQLHGGVHRDGPSPGLLVAHVVDTDLPVEDPLLEAPGDSLDIRLFDAGTATVVDVLVVSPEGREEELRQETAGDLRVRHGPVGGDEFLGPLATGDVLVDRVFTERVNRRRVVEDLAQGAVCVGSGEDRREKENDLKLRRVVVVRGRV